MNTKNNFTKGDPDLRYVKYLTRLMDSEFSLPGTKFRFGLDPILGLIPGVGDIASYAVSGLIIFYISRYGASRKVIYMMVGNAALDAVIGSIPLLGHIFDFYYKANERNLRLLQEHYEEGKYQGKGTRFLTVLIIVFIVIFIILILIIWAIITAIFSLF
ncbi:MAG: DUF4112 domain-containing protein [Candidatus Cyclobacteriaceae bacterium M2_1C_046]